MSKFEIRHLSTGRVIYKDEADSFSVLVKAAVHARVSLSGANLYGVDLSGANLSHADLYGVDLSGANLSHADLTGANLSGASLSGSSLSRADLRDACLCHTNLSDVNLTRANLSRANLYRAKLSGASLYRADLTGANLSRADLYGASLYGANLYGANLYGASLYGANNADLIFAQLSIVPEHGPFFAWKKCRNEILARLFIPSKAKRSNATGRKCRAERAKVLEVIGAEVGVSLYDKNFTYKVGQWVYPDKWDDNRWEECSSGIHFFLTRVEAENHE